MPKGVVLSHGSILANAAQISAAFPFSSKEKFMSTLPLFHAFGLTAGVILPHPEWMPHLPVSFAASLSSDS